MSDCPLCALERRTRWHYEGPDFVILDCQTCSVPMVVIRKHTTEPSVDERERALAGLRRVADQVFGTGGWRFDEGMRAVPGHWHCHARAM